MSRRRNKGQEAFKLHQEAYARSDAGDVPGTIAMLTDLVAKHPNYAAGWCSLAMFRIVTRDFTGALGAARRAISCDPEKAVGHINAGIALRELGHLEESRRHLEEAI
ncbi:MAG: hypothetical protein Q7S02_01145, partial [bacterium]|nr:hypothetical protein [bacterium]